MEWQTFFLYLFVMAGVTYLIRAIPLVLCKQELTNRFVRSFLAYVPYAVLGAMTFPAIFYSTDGLASALAGTVVALVLAFFEKGLLTVAVGACVVSFLVQVISVLV
ncbi:MAG: AzlD domain-containing protein [Butyribacter sp.]|nr:AzlD domain-containing protein [bacterium]MDY3853370.1 AzlD domain-containing protein [Butyribacter sp.]